LQEKFWQLTDADLKFETGKEEDLLKRIEIRLKKKRNEIMKRRIQVINATSLLNKLSGISKLSLFLVYDLICCSVSELGSVFLGVYCLNNPL
jgi:hypothetical protein